ncbi:MULTISPECIES: hypothetical protein [unclassified Knoellia]|uniref:hypothetical protein n=1 Tax=Knoellia altitudinis TaxID=3404795 RepID=UPI003623D8DD
MGKVFSRPVVLLPLGVVLLVVGLLTGLGAVGAWRWGGVVEDGRACGAGREDMCLVRDDVAIDGPNSSWRSAGNDWTLTPSSGPTHEVALPGRASDELGDATEAVMLSQPDGDVVGVEAGGRSVGTTWFGAYGVLQRVGLGLLGLSLGGGLVVASRRMRRATGSWVEHEPLQRHGSAALALPVVVGFVLWIVPRFLW